MKLMRIATLTTALALLGAGPALAVTQLVGDVDGFGFPSTAGLTAANGGPADVDTDGLLEAGEYLPDLNTNGSVAINSGDQFDNREAAEVAAADGAQWTDNAIIGNGAADGATFVFTFPVPVLGDIDFGVDHFINLVLGDYDVVPASLSVDGVVVPLTQQQNSAGQDGLVQSAFATVAWADMLDGQVVIEIIAPNEPYLAFDYALLDTDEFADFDNDGVPDPIDNCFDVPNTDQADADGDGIGDACDACPFGDLDGDGVCDGDDNCPGVANADQADADADGLGDACDACPADAGNDADGDGFCESEDNCPATANPGQEDADGDGFGDACDDCTDVDMDGVCIEDDACPGTLLPEDVPTVKLGVNRFALVDGDGVFDTVSPKGKGPGRSYTLEDTAGCSCAQIIEALGLGAGHEKFGCSISAMDEWTAMMSMP